MNSLNKKQLYQPVYKADEKRSKIQEQFESEK